MRFVQICAMAAVFLGMACHGDHKVEEDHAAHENAAPNESPEALKIALNDGAKWEMDAHTRDMFKAMTERVEAAGDAKDVGVALSADLEKLIQGCTMTGEAHNQLHAFLIAYMPEVKILAETGSQDSFGKVKHLLEEFPTYFE